MHVERHAVPITTAADGSATAYTEKAVTGRVVAVSYAKTDFDNGVDFTITTETTLQDIWVETNVNASTVRAPRQATHGTDGVARLYAAGGSAVGGYVHAAFERIKIVIAQGGNVKSGTFYILVG